MKAIVNLTTKNFVFSSLLLIPAASYASLLDFQGNYASELEERAAISNQQAYDELKAQGCQDNDRAATASCSGTTFIVWNNVRELVHTANDLSNNGQPTAYSLGLGLEGLGFSLRWTAGEEFSSEGSMSNSFVSGQLSGLSSRISALRSGASGFNLSGIGYNDNDIAMGYDNNKRSGNNAGDDMIDAWSRWGGFLNGSYTYGNQEASELEDAFDFDGNEINGGIDYRIDNNWVVGALVGYQKQEINFDSSKSIVDGGVEMDAYSILPFVLYQSDQWYYSASLGYQRAEFDTNRSIRYPSLNPDTDSTDTVATSTNSADIFSSSLTAGYSFFLNQSLSFEPSVTVNYQDITIEEYSEEDISNDGFNFNVEEQHIESLETVANLKLQYVISSRYGVFIPYADIGFYAQHHTDPEVIYATYGDASAQLSADSKFALPTDSTDGDYKIYTIGLSSVIRGASQDTFGAAASGGIQVYVNYREIKDIGNYQQKIIAGGLRYEF